MRAKPNIDRIGLCPQIASAKSRDPQPNPRRLPLASSIICWLSATPSGSDADDDAAVIKPAIIAALQGDDSHDTATMCQRYCTQSDVGFGIGPSCPAAGGPRGCSSAVGQASCTSVLSVPIFGGKFDIGATQDEWRFARPFRSLGARPGKDDRRRAQTQLPHRAIHRYIGRLSDCLGPPSEEIKPGRIAKHPREQNSRVSRHPLPLDEFGHGQLVPEFRYDSVPGTTAQHPEPVG